MSYVLPFTGEQIKNVIDGRMNSFIQDIYDGVYHSGNKQAVSAGTEYRFEFDGVPRNSVTAPTYITSRWDLINNNFAVPEELDRPTYVANISLMFDPSVSATGSCTIRAYIDDATTPKLIGEYNYQYKAIVDDYNTVITWYLGEESGYDAKNDGVYFTYEFSGAGDVWDRKATIYRT